MFSFGVLRAFHTVFPPRADQPQMSVGGAPITVFGPPPRGKRPPKKLRGTRENINGPPQVPLKRVKKKVLNLEDFLKSKIYW